MGQAVMLHNRSLLPGKWALSLWIAALGLCGVALLNGGPIYYPDTAAYILDADRLADFEAPFAVRPVFYGLAIWPFHWDTFFFPALLIQALIIAHLIYLTARTCDCGLRPLGFLGLMAALILLTPVSFHVSHLLPDIFVGALILVLFLLGFCRDRLSRAEKCYLVVLGAACTSFHLTAIPVGLALVVMCLLFSIMARRRAATLLVLAPVVLGIVVSLGFSVAVFQRVTLTPKSPPHFLARILADGPGRDFLRETCSQSKLILCDYQDRITATEDDFLWRLLPSIPPADGYRILTEQQQVVRGTIAKYPLQVMAHMLSNMLRQLVTFQSETQVNPEEWAQFQAGGTPLARSLEHSRQSEGWFDKASLAGVNGIHAAIVAISLPAMLLLARIAFRRRLFRLLGLVATVLTGLVANAFACGAFGGVFARYEGRVVWLLPLAAVVCALAVRRARTSLVPPIRHVEAPTTC